LLVLPFRPVTVGVLLPDHLLEGQRMRHARHTWVPRHSRGFTQVQLTADFSPMFSICLLCSPRSNSRNTDICFYVAQVSYP
jgi:hypothetical protein